MRYMVIESFRGGDPAPVYARLAERGRQLPDGLSYVDSWVADDLTRCFQLVDCDDPALLDAWTAAWDDLVAFEIVPVIASAQAQARAARRP